MNSPVTRLISMFLALILTVGLLPGAALAGPDGRGEADVPQGNAMGTVAVDLPGGRAITEAYLAGDTAAVNALTPGGTRDALPAKYDSRSYGWITPVRNQNPYGTCWAFAAIASVEAYMIKHGIRDGVTGAPADTSINLSESHLAWFSYTDAYDPLGLLYGDATRPGDSTFLDQGGNLHLASDTLMRRTGPASEVFSDLQYENVTEYGLDPFYACGYNSAHVTDAEWISMANRNAVKWALMDYGAGAISYFHSDEYMNTGTWAYCCDQTGVNHSVTLVGWDDNYSRYNFNPSCRPASNGAWIVKNSWGTSWGINGYFYLSYEDVSCLNDFCCFYRVGDENNYADCYQYDGTSNFVNCVRLEQNGQAANVFTVNGNELLKAVALCHWDEATSYTLKIYKNPGVNNPATGTLMTTQSGYFLYPGYKTIQLDQPVALSAGDRFSVVFTLSTPASGSEGGAAYMPYDATCDAGWISWTHADHGRTSFYRQPGGAWTDCPNSGDFRIKAYTDPDVHAIDVNGRLLSGSGSGYTDEGSTSGWGTFDVYINGSLYLDDVDDFWMDWPEGTAYSIRDIRGVGLHSYAGSIGSLSGTVGKSDVNIRLIFRPITMTVSPNPIRLLPGAGTWIYVSSPYGDAVDVLSCVSYDESVARVTSTDTFTDTSGASFYVEAVDLGEAQLSVRFAREKAFTEILIPVTVDYNPFVDVSRSDYFYNAVMWAYYHDPRVTGGTDKTHFSPNATCTREQIVTFLHAAYGKPPYYQIINPFTDVKEGAYYYNAVMWAVANNITSGVGGGKFGVGRPCTREQVVTFLWTAAGKPKPTAAYNPFKDVKAGQYYYQPVMWAVEHGITKGMTADTFGVGKTCTRAQVVTFLYKAMGIYE